MRYSECHTQKTPLQMVTCEKKQNKVMFKCANPPIFF